MKLAALVDRMDIRGNNEEETQDLRDMFKSDPKSLHTEDQLEMMTEVMQGLAREPDCSQTRQAAINFGAMNDNFEAMNARTSAQIGHCRKVQDSHRSCMLWMENNTTRCRQRQWQRKKPQTMQKPRGNRASGVVSFS